MAHHDKSEMISIVFVLTLCCIFLTCKPHKAYKGTFKLNCLNSFLCHVGRVGAGQTRAPARLLSGICADEHSGTGGMGNTNALKNTKYPWTACLCLNIHHVIAR